MIDKNIILLRFKNQSSSSESIELKKAVPSTNIIKQLLRTFKFFLKTYVEQKIIAKVKFCQ